jgi:hypothetical protein
VRAVDAVGRLRAVTLAAVVSRAFERTLRDFRQWSGAEPGDRLWSLETLLEGRERWLGQMDPTLWRTGQAHALLMDVAVPRLTVRYDLDVHAVPVLREFLRFLDETELLHPGSTRVPTLLKELDRLQPKFDAEMRNPSGFRLAKRIFIAMHDEGVDAADDDAVDKWVEAFNGRSRAERVPVLGHLLDENPQLGTARFVVREGTVAALAPDAPIPPQLERHSHDEHGCDWPAVRLPSEPDLAAAATSSQLLNRMLALARWIGSGRPVTKRGMLLPKDAGALLDELQLPRPKHAIQESTDVMTLNQAWNLAIGTELIQLRRTRVQAGPRLAAHDVLDLWTDIFRLLVERDTGMLSADPKQAEVQSWLQPWGPRAVSALYGKGGATDLDTLLPALTNGFASEAETRASDLLERLAGVHVRGLLAELAEHNAVTVHGAKPDPEVLTAEQEVWLGQPAWVIAPDPGITVRLTGLGTYAVRLRLLAEGCIAPLLQAE